MKTYTPHAYQQSSLRWLIQRTLLDGEEGGAYFLDPGLGKTSVTLAWIRLLKSLGIAKKILIVAPIRVIDSTWPSEIADWEQFAHLTYSKVRGTPTQRMLTLARNADIYLINPDGLAWLTNYYRLRPFPFDTLVVDESTGFKSWTCKRTKALRKLIPKFSRRLILTGTPSPNGLMDLFAQTFIVDRGQALGTAITKFQNRYFYKDGFQSRQWRPHETSFEAIQKLIAPVVFRLSAKDHLDLPELLVHDVWVDLPTAVQKQYRKLEREMFYALDQQNERVLMNAGAKYNACRQVAGGGLYDDDHKPYAIHSAKIEAIVSIVEELQGKPVLIPFMYRHDLLRLRQAFPKIESIDGDTTSSKGLQLIDGWNAGEVHLLAVQPQSLSHGVNMQRGPGRDIVWMGLPDNLDYYNQINARVYRQGVTSNVRVHRILARKTVDEAVRNRIESKDSLQTSLLAALNQYRIDRERSPA